MRVKTLIGCAALTGLFGLFTLTFVPPQPSRAAQATPTSRPTGTSRTDAKGIPQVWVPPGCFTMGEDNAVDFITKFKAPGWTRRTLGLEAPAHEVCLTQGYWIDQYEVTNKAFQRFTDAGGYDHPEYWSEAGKEWLAKQEPASLPVACEDTEPDHPRVCVTWYEAEAYATWRGGRFPTEAEWEYAARGPESRLFPWGNEWDPARANVVDSTGLTPVGSYPAGVSWVDAHDMAGNAMEWVQDWLSRDYYNLKVRDNPPGAAKGDRKVEKGGWWGSTPFVARSSYRHFEDPPEYQDHHIGFRIMTPEG